MEIVSKSLQQTETFAQKVAKNLQPGNVLSLYGDLGSGKTTFTRFLVRALGFDVRVQSPTFIVARKYTGGTGVIKVINHIDLYRLTTKEEVFDIGIKDFLAEKDALAILEWPELAEVFLPEDVIKIFFEYKGENVRVLNIVA